MNTSLANCDSCGVGITNVTHRVNCGYCKRCGGVESVAFYLPKTLHGPADVAAVTDEEEAEENKEEDPLLVESSYVLIDMAQLLGSPMTADVSTGLNAASR